MSQTGTRIARVEIERLRATVTEQAVALQRSAAFLGIERTRIMRWTSRAQR
jgi:hypothetical protein